jgi:hypothetical protein
MAGRAGWSVAASLAGVALAGCGLPGPVGAGVNSTCTDISGGACQEQVTLVAARHPGAESVELRCGVAACDRRGGAGSAIVTMQNGARVDDAFSYVGDGAPMPQPDCMGIAPATCRRFAEDAFENTAPSKRLVRIEIGCTTAVCTDLQGEADVKLVYADGLTDESGIGWQGAGQP